MKTENNTHDTYVLGINKEREIKFFKTYNYSIQEAEAQSDLKQIQSTNQTWEIGRLTSKIQELLYVQKKWYDLEEKISKCYPEYLDEADEEGEEYYENADLTTIGELAASAFGFL